MLSQPLPVRTAGKPIERKLLIASGAIVHLRDRGAGQVYHWQTVLPLKGALGMNETFKKE